jgi:hypothetical protein
MDSSPRSSRVGCSFHPSIYSVGVSNLDSGRTGLRLAGVAFAAVLG